MATIAKESVGFHCLSVCVCVCGVGVCLVVWWCGGVMELAPGTARSAAGAAASSQKLP